MVFKGLAVDGWIQRRLTAVLGEIGKWERWSWRDGQNGIWPGIDASEGGRGDLEAIGSDRKG